MLRNRSTSIAPVFTTCASHLRIGEIACSGAASEVDEAIRQAAVDALLKK